MTWRLSRRACMVTLGALFVAAGMASGCRHDDEVRATIDEVTALADAIVEAVRDAPTPQAGVAEARRLLADARDGLTERVLAIKRMRSGAMSPQLQRKWRDAFIDALAKVEGLRTELREAIAADPELGRALEALIAELADILRRRPAD